MKLILFLYILLMFSCANNAKKNVDIKKHDTIYTTINNADTQDIKDSILADQIKFDEIKNFDEFNNFKIYKITDTIKEDFNGDGMSDFIFIDQNHRGVYFINGKTKNLEKISLDKPFEEMLKETSWIDYWGTTTDKEIEKIDVDKNGDLGESSKTKIDHVSLFFRKVEEGGGVLTYKSTLKKFIWLHQSC